MSLDEVSKKYPSCKDLPRLRDLAVETLPEYPKFAFFCMLKILEDLVEVKKAHQEDVSLSSLIENVKTLAEKYKKDYGVSFQQDAEEFMSFVARKFEEADSSLRSGNATPLTIKTLLDSALMLGVFTLFGPLEQETSKRQKYARVMAAKLVKNLGEMGNVNSGLAFLEKGTPKAEGGTSGVGGNSFNTPLE